jgi:NADPH2 dehydrogenase
MKTNQERKILEPMTLRKTVIRNRAVFPPVTCIGMAPQNGVPGADRLDHYTKIAETGMGIIILEACCVRPDARLHPDQLGLWDDMQIDGLSTIVSAIRQKGVACIIQIHHAGARTHPEINNVPVVPSVLKTDDGKHVRVASTAELTIIRENFINAAIRAEKAGADGVELHGAHNYLLSEMASPVFNQRTDAYGGNQQKRLRLALEIIEGIRANTGQNFILGYRMGGNEPTYIEGIRIAKILEASGVDFLHVSYGYPRPDDESASVCPDFDYNSVVYGASLIKQSVRMPVIAVNRIQTLTRGEWLLRNGHADMIAYARPVLADYEFFRRSISGQDKSDCLLCSPRCFWYTDSRLCPARRLVKKARGDF